MTTGVRSPGGRELTKLELWEAGRRLLGYGDWTEDHPDPYLKWAGMQAHRLFLSMNKRGVSQEDFLLCAEYCQRHHIRIENAVWVFRHYQAAKKEQRALAADRPSQLEQLVQAAIFRERALADDMSESWCSRLTRSQGQYREEVLHEWAQFRHINDLTSLVAR